MAHGIQPLTAGRLQCFTEEYRQAGPIQLMLSHPDHGLVSCLFRQSACIDAVDFQEIQRRLDCRPFIAVKVGLAFGKMIGISRSDFVQVAIPVTVHILRLSYGRFEPVLVAQTRQAAPRFKLVPVNHIDLFPSEKDGLWFQVENRR